MSNRVADFTIGEGGTDIKNVKAGVSANDKVYDLSGKFVKTLQKDHIYIRNGKKFIHK